MADGAQPQALRYSAFISYSRRDARFARSLHRQLEGYRLPRRGATRAGPDGAAHARLRPLFRDEEEFCASYDLSSAVREAIARSDFLIVVCSPNSAASKWVGLEIEDFRAVHGDSHILAALIEGDSLTAFHPALRGSKAITPLAADFRKGAGSHRLSLLKLVAPMAGVGLDELAQRDAHRQTRRITAVAAAAVGATVLMGALTTVTFFARADAERQRNEALGLVSYMLNDLRSEAKNVGGLELLATVNNGALKYYRGQDLSELSDQQLRQRAQLLQAIGEDDEKRGELDAASVKFGEARRSTGNLLAKKPNDPQRIFAHSQSEYWVGFINWRRGDGDGARKGFGAYANLAKQLNRINPTNVDWQRETAYAESNLGMLALRLDGDAARAERHFSTALRVFVAIASRSGDTASQLDLADGYAWLADSQRLQGTLGAALEGRSAQRRLLETMAARDPENKQVRALLIYNALALARIEADRGAWKEALQRLDSGHASAVSFSRSDPSNGDMIKEARMFELFKVRTQLEATPGRSTPTQAAIIGDCVHTAPTLRTDDEIHNLCMTLRARLLAKAGDLTGAKAALSAVREPSHPEAYSKRWGLNFVQEAAWALNP